MIVQGAVTLDHYEVDKKTMTVEVAETHTQEKIMVKKGSGNAITKLSEKVGGKRKLTHPEIIALAEIGKRLENIITFLSGL